MARPRLSEGTRIRLLEASVAAFLEHGYHGTGIKQVLDRVDVPKGSFYNYFASKEALGVAAIQHYSAQLDSQLAAALDGAADPLAGVREYFDQQIRDFVAAEYVGGCLLANLAGELDGSEASRRALATAFRRWRDALAEALARAQALGTVRDDVAATELADMLIEAWEGAVIRMKIDQSVAPLERCLQRLLDGYFRP